MLETTMNRTTVRIAAMVLAVGFTLFELVGIGLLAEQVGSSRTADVALPRIVITPTGAYIADHRGGTWTESVDASSAVHVRAVNQARN
jgi:hypothetical protein